MLAEVARMQPYLKSSHGRSFQIGIGIHSGDVVL